MRRLLLSLSMLSLLTQVQAQGPAVSAQSAIVMDVETGKVLWSKSPDTKRYPASTTKIMTALLLIEHCPLDEVIKAPADVEKVTQASLHLKPGEEVTAGEMLYALMLRSANDGCYAVASHISGSIDAFAKLMNERAKALGCANTDFKNPHGLNNKEHMTTARDLALIAREAMKYEAFNRVVKTYKHTIKRSMNQEDLLLISKNKSLKKDPTADGVKTGYTNPAGQCFVGSATRDGYRVITVILKSEGWQDDNKAMLDWAFKHHERTPVAKSGEPVLNAPVQGSATAKLALEEDLSVIHRKGATVQPTVELEAGTPLRGPLVKGQRVGFAVVRDGAGYEFKVPVVAAEGVSAPVSVLGVASTMGTGHWVLAGILGGGALFMRRRARTFRFGG